MYRYGDGTPFPLDENFIETIIPRPEPEKFPRLSRADRSRAVAAFAGHGDARIAFLNRGTGQLFGVGPLVDHLTQPRRHPRVWPMGVKSRLGQLGGGRCWRFGARQFQRNIALEPHLVQ